jgi:hypothetical protein
MNERYGERTYADTISGPVSQEDYGHLAHCSRAHRYDPVKHEGRGLKRFREAGVERAVLEELQQLHDRKVLEPISTCDMSHEEKRAALEYLMFLKKKRNGSIKGRGCADGRKQRLYTTKEEASSPTVAIEAVMLSCVIDAMEKRDVATVDIPGAFMRSRHWMKPTHEAGR